MDLLISMCFFFYIIPTICVIISIYYILQNNDVSQFDILVKKYNVMKFYNGRDPSHGIDHIKRVFFWLEKLIENMEDENDRKIVSIAALFHDAYDHKYSPKENPQEWIDYKKRLINKSIDKYTTNKEQKLIHRIIDNVSFTKEKDKRMTNNNISIRLMNCHNNQKKNNHEEYLRNIVSDADKLDAIGKEAIDRMYYYHNHVNTLNKQYSDEWFHSHIHHIRTHCIEKLYILMDYTYIKTDKGRYYGNECIQDLKDIVEDDTKLTEYIKQIE